jgi:hypothetical protein
MEYVPGEAITGLCDRRNLSIRQRLANRRASRHRQNQMRRYILQKARRQIH